MELSPMTKMCGALLKTFFEIYWGHTFRLKTRSQYKKQELADRRTFDNYFWNKNKRWLNVGKQQPTRKFEF